MEWNNNGEFHFSCSYHCYLSSLSGEPPLRAGGGAGRGEGPGGGREGETAEPGQAGGGGQGEACQEQEILKRKVGL